MLITVAFMHNGFGMCRALLDSAKVHKVYIIFVSLSGLSCQLGNRAASMGPYVWKRLLSGKGFV